MNVNFEDLKLLPQMFALIEQMNKELKTTTAKRWYNAKELAEYLGYSKDRIYKIKAEYFIEGVHFFNKTGKILFDRVAIDSWVVEGETTNDINITRQQVVGDILSSIKEI